MQPNPAWNQTSGPYPRGESLHNIVQAIATEHGENIALVHGDERVSYRRLNQAADAYAVRLAALGVGTGDLVPVMLPRSPELIATMLSVLKLGAGYALVDAAWPVTRVRDVIDQLDARILVALPGHPEGIPIPVWSPPPGGLAGVEGEGYGFRPADVRGSDPCCVFFTSGTTGRPKGVLTPHRATVRLFGPGTFARFSADSVMPQAASTPWDGFSLEVWSVLLNGGVSLIVDEPYLSPLALRDAVASRGVDIAWLTSSLFNLIVDEDPGAFDGMDQVMIGGERLSVPHVRRFLEHHPGITLINGYGPVESTVFAATHRITVADCARYEGIPIGRPVPNTQIHILDGNRLCAVGEAGELCIAGDGLALGYVGQEALTAEKFVEVVIHGRPVRVYRSGDIGLWDSEGLLHYKGRADRQVKIRGHRIEPAEVERQIEAQLKVRRCAVVTHRDEADNSLSLAAFCVPESPGDQLEEALNTLRRTLVSYHVPAELLSVEAFPLTSNGKLDEATLLGLLAPFAEARDELAYETAQYEESDPLVRQVASIFASVLGCSAVPADAPFTALGGTSLDAGRVCVRLASELDRPVPVSRLFARATARSLADWVRETAVQAPTASEQAPDAPLTSTQAGFLMRRLLDPHDRSGHCLAAWIIDGTLDLRALNAAVADVHARHASLNSVYTMGRGQASAMPATMPAPSPVTLPPAPSLDSALAALRAELAQPLAVETGQIWRTALVPLADDGRTVFGYVVHHIAFDGWSEAVLGGDLATAYNARRRGIRPNLQPIPSPTEVRAIRDEYLRLADLDAQRAGLATQLQGVPELNYPREAELSDSAEPLRTEELLTSDEVAELDVAAAAGGLTRFSILLSLYARALADATGQDDFGVGIPVVQRTDARLEGLVGCHIGMVCIRMRGSALGGDDYAAVETGRLAQQAFSRQDVDFGDVVRLVNPPRSTRSPLFQNIFAYQDNASPFLRLEDARAEFRRLPYLGIPAEILAEVWPEQGGLRVVVNSDPASVPATVARGLAKGFANLVRTAGHRGI